MSELPKWVMDAMDPDMCGAEELAFQEGARLVLDRLAATAEGDRYPEAPDYESPETAAYNNGRDDVRKEVLE